MNSTILTYTFRLWTTSRLALLLILPLISIHTIQASTTQYHIEKSYLESATLLRDQQLLTISKYTDAPTHSTEESKLNMDPDTLNSDEHQTLKVGLFSTDHQLVLPLLELDYYNTHDHTISIHTIESQDLNQDGLMDIMINIQETANNIVSLITTSFFLNTGTNFIEIKQSFNKAHYELTSPNILIVNAPLYDFGKPYDDPSGSKNTIYWRDHFKFTDTDLVQINDQYAQYYQKRLQSAETTLNQTLSRIRDFKMSSSSANQDQLQLNEFFASITNQKILIYKCRAILSN